MQLCASSELSFCVVVRRCRGVFNFASSLLPPLFQTKSAKRELDLTRISRSQTFQSFFVFFVSDSAIPSPLLFIAILAFSHSSPFYSSSRQSSKLTTCNCPFTMLITQCILGSALFVPKVSRKRRTRAKNKPVRKPSRLESMIPALGVLLGLRST